MIKNIDNDEDNTISGYGYTNSSGDTESVYVCNDTSLLGLCVDGTNLYIYKADVDKLIKALTLAAKL